MHTSATLILRRVDRLVSERLQPAVIADRRPLELTAWEAPGEPVPFTEAAEQTYTPVAPGLAWGAPWSTTWLHARGLVPAQWTTSGRYRIELAVDLGFTGSGPGFQAEGLVYTPDGTILEAVSPRNQRIALADHPGAVEVYIEAAGNPDVSNFGDFRPTSLGVPEAREQGPLYTLRHVDLVLRDEHVAGLLADVTALLELARELGEDSTRRAQILRALDQAVDLVDPEDVPGSAAAAREHLAPVLAVRATEGTHEVVAVGHAHIDSAWLWPTRETIRKCARTFANVLALMEEDPEFTFVCS
ncbi:MAG TPA: alpha-mannosidase, partial [Candidatus Ruania gallistercoris]|nr:alpha-mannosidase [Candidatus Ruania gallistercoris]